jgi:Putative zinc- or iron-chelating domain
MGVIPIPHALAGAGEKLQQHYAEQYAQWLWFFKKAAGHVSQGRKRRGEKVQWMARREIDRTIAAFRSDDDPLKRLACAKGCAHCCYFNVDVTELEADRLAMLVREMPEVRRQDVVRRLEEASRQPDDPGQYRYPCPFLEDNQCSIYDERPLQCRSHVSPSVQFCIVESEATSKITASTPGVDPHSLLGMLLWKVLLASISIAATTLIGSAGSLAPMVLERLRRETR